MRRLLPIADCRRGRAGRPSLTPACPGGRPRVLVIGRTRSSGVRALAVLTVSTLGPTANVEAAGQREVVLQIDRAALRRQDVDALRNEVRATLREKSLAAGASFESTPLGVKVILPDPAGRAGVREALTALSRRLPNGGATLEVRDDPVGVGVSQTPGALDEHVRTTTAQTAEILRRRIDAAGLEGGRVAVVGDDRIRADVPESTVSARVTALLSTQARLEFRPVLAETTPLGDGEILPSDEAGTDRKAFRVERQPIVTGDDLLDVSPGIDSVSNMSVIDIRLSSAAAARFGRFTTANIRRQVAIVLDGRVLSAPIIVTAITGGALQINGNFTRERARSLALLLRNGALPAKLIVLSDDVSSGSVHGK